MQQRRNTASKEIGGAMKDGRTEEVEALKAEVANLKSDMEAVEAEERAASDALNELLTDLPNILDDDVPDGKDEADNLEVRAHG
ncbi:MAG: serine--tRNA ligase, partial [Alphaproteobacteria bacterium]